MKKTKFILSVAALFVFNCSPAFAGQAPKVKEEAVNLALKEEAMRQAFQEAEINVFSQDIDELTAFPGLFSRVHPYFNMGIVYDDNIWEIKDNVQSDLYLDFTPGVKFILGNLEESDSPNLKQGLEIDLGADITHSFYRDVDLNREGPYTKVKYLLGSGRNQFKLSHNFNIGYMLQSNLSVDTRGLSKYMANDTDLGWEYTFNRLGIGLGYNRRAWNYYKDFKASNTYLDNMGVITGFFKVSPKTRVFLEYNYGKYEYTKALTTEKDYTYNQFWVGINGQITSKLSGLAKFGYQTHQYKTLDKNAPAFIINLLYEPSLKNNFTIKLSSGERVGSYVDEGNDEFFAAGLDYRRNISNKLSLISSINFEKDDYASGRDDKYYNCSVGLNYALYKWMGIRLGYDFKNRTSNQSNAGYKSNSYYLSTEMKF